MRDAIVRMQYQRTCCRRTIGLCLLLSVACLTGCGFLNVNPEIRAAAKHSVFQACAAKFYLPYAVLAAAAYGTDTQADFSRAILGGNHSEVLEAAKAVRDETFMPSVENQMLGPKQRVAILETCRATWEQKTKELNEKSNCNPKIEKCSERTQVYKQSAGAALPLACIGAFQTDRKLPSWLTAGASPYLDEYPSKDSRLDCDPGSDVRTTVPVTLVAKAVGWQRRKDIERYATTRKWMIFVPGLGVEVWSRDRLREKNMDVDGPPREYAIVFRGTADAGGWFSNFRLVTGLIPVFWDQYQQAEWSTKQIVDQIRLIELEKWLRESGTLDLSKPEALIGFNDYFPYITTVGHSLGAGLAKYVYFRIREISKVIGFNPSPVDGARTFVGVNERPHIMTGRRQAEPTKVCSEAFEAEIASDQSTHVIEPSVAQRIKDPNPRFPTLYGESTRPTRAVFFNLYERGELLNSTTPCSSGPEWGSEGGPESECQMVDLVKIPYTVSGMFKQHSMNMMACKLSAVLWQKAAPIDSVREAWIR